MYPGSREEEVVLEGSLESLSHPFQSGHWCLTGYQQSIRKNSKQVGIVYILSVNEKLPVSKFRYFGKYIIQLFGYCTFMFLGNDMIV